VGLLDGARYPFDSDKGQRLVEALLIHYDKVSGVRALAEDCGINIRNLENTAGAEDALRDVLKKGASDRKLRRLVTHVLEKHPQSANESLFRQLLAEPQPADTSINRTSFDRDFRNWAFGGGRRLGFLALALATVGVTITSIVWNAISGSGWITRAIKYAPLATNFIVAVVFLVLLKRTRDPAASPLTQRSVRRLRGLWNWILSFWIILYVLYLATQFVSDKAPDQWQLRLGLRLASHAVRNANAITLFAAFYEMSQKTVDDRGKHTGLRPSPGTSVAILVVCAAIEGFLLWLARDNDSTAHRYSLAFAFDAGCWLVTAACMALFVARLESQFIGLPHTMLLILYMYSGLQALGPFVNLNEAIGDTPPAAIQQYINTLNLTAYSLAMVFKLVLCMVVQWFFEQRASFYFASVRELYAIVPDRFKEFTHTKGHRDPEYGVFLSAPLSSRGDDEVRQANEIFDRIALKLKQTYDVETTLPNTRRNTTESPLERRRENFFSIRRARIFVLVLDVREPSSALIELGVALSHHRPTIIYHLGDAPLPNLAQAEPAGALRSFSIASLADIPDRIADDLMELLT
jgi:hypothetical protein